MDVVEITEFGNIWIKSIVYCEFYLTKLHILLILHSNFIINIDYCTILLYSTIFQQKLRRLSIL